MRDKIRDIVVQAVAGTKDLTQAIDELVELKEGEQDEDVFAAFVTERVNTKLIARAIRM